jgi:hypothetical protein
MDDDPLRGEPARDIDIGLEIFVDRLADIGRVFRDIHRRQRVQAEMDAALNAGGADRCAAPLVEAGQRVGGSVELDVDVAHVVALGPGHCIFEPESASDIDADAIAQGHAWAN